MFLQQTSEYNQYLTISPIEATLANSADQDEQAPNEPPHQDLHSLSIVLKFENITFLRNGKFEWTNEIERTIGMEQPIMLLRVERVIREFVKKLNK